MTLRRLRGRAERLIPMAMLLATLLLALQSYRPWPMAVAARHLAAAPNCTAARIVGLAPSSRGQPGYWGQHDADADGIACEPITPANAAASSWHLPEPGGLP
jgi:hypothetical protein